MDKLKSIQKKWQKKWEEAKLFEAEPDLSKKKFFATFPYPYINTSPHLGHAYSLSRNDIMIRFYRMLGYNTLFPIGFHATGEPIVGAAKRLAKGDKSQIRAFELSGIKKEDIEKFKDPYYIVKYFFNEFKKDFKDFGVAVDWRRSFYTTSLNPEYSAFITWQFNSLKEMGLIAKGTHPVIYCPECESACGSHDRKEGEDATLNEFTLLKFKIDDYYLIAATLRPETVFGQTNLWVNPKVEYAKAKAGDETWVISNECFEKLKWQIDDLKILETIKGEDLLGKMCLAPMIKKEIIILPSMHCDPKIGTGIVTSVPSDAPYDYIALKNLWENEKLCKEYGLDFEKIKKIKPIPIIECEELGDLSAIAVCKEMGISDLSQKELLEKATKQVYRIGFHKGKMNKSCGKYFGKKVEEAKEKIEKEMIANNEASMLYESSEPVVCRCLTSCVVKILKDQWFLRYSDDEWKKKALKCLDEMKVYPDEAKNVMRNMIIKMKDKACARKSGLGTPLPCDTSCNIECLSDSTIYMSYYIIQKHVFEKKISAKNMVKEFFDFVLLGKGDAKKAADKSNSSQELLKKIREEFEYFYPVDLRNSGKDLLTNHLLFFIYNHVAFWPEKFWPQAIGANGWMTVDGEKMSKSKGNFIPLKKANEEYGADASRLAFLDTGEGISDADFSTKAAENFGKKMLSILSKAAELKKIKGNEKTIFDNWLVSKIQSRIAEFKKAMFEMLNRSAMKESFHGLLSDILYYYSSSPNPNHDTLKYAWSVFCRLNVPFMPHACEEINELIGEKDFVHNLKLPEYDKNLVDSDSEQGIEFLKSIQNDISKIIELAKKQPNNIKIFICAKWKYKFSKEFAKHFKTQKNQGALISEFMSKDEYRPFGKEISTLIGAFLKDPSKIPMNILGQEKEFNALNEIKKFIEKEFNSKIEIINAEDSMHPKAKSAMPGKPGILIE